MTDSCKRVTAKKYRSRPSPPFHAGDCKGQVKKGNDGQSYKSEADKRGVYRWVAQGAQATRKVKRGTTYSIHDNGGRPFEVVDLGGRVAISVLQQGAAAAAAAAPTYKAWKEMAYKKLFVGKAPVRAGTRRAGQPTRRRILDGSDTPSPKGSSLLLQVSKGKYVYIGDKIYEFETFQKEDILEYYSPMGPNDVPYPWARGKSRTYLMLELVALDNAVLPSGTKDPYAEYYKLGDQKMCKKGYGGDECKDLSTPEAKVYLKTMEAGEHKMKSKLLHKRLWG